MGTGLPKEYQDPAKKNPAHEESGKYSGIAKKNLEGAIISQEMDGKG
jgi:hypothetical protein